MSRSLHSLPGAEPLQVRRTITFVLTFPLCPETVLFNSIDKPSNVKRNSDPVNAPDSDPGSARTGEWQRYFVTGCNREGCRSKG